MAVVGLLALCAAFIGTVATTTTSELTFKKLKKDGIVSGFGTSSGDPLRFRNRIPRINDPTYINVTSGLYQSEQLCVGFRAQSGWRFSPITILNSREIVNHDNRVALCYCPLAGLTVAIEGDISISGLLKYDTFVLYDNKQHELILPFTQDAYSKDRFIPLRELQLLNFSGVVNHFAGAKILDPERYIERNPYGSYATNDLQGIGHEKPGLKKPFKKSDAGLHPKELCLIAGYQGRLQRAYPFTELKKSVPKDGGSFEDTLNGKRVLVYFYPQHRWAYVKDKDNQSLNLAYAYVFSMLQHLPGIPIYRKASL